MPRARPVLCRPVPNPESSDSQQTTLTDTACASASDKKKLSLGRRGRYAILAGLYLPTSDIDAVLLHSGCRDPRQGLKALAKALTNRDMATNVQV